MLLGVVNQWMAPRFRRRVNTGIAIAAVGVLALGIAAVSASASQAAENARLSSGEYADLVAAAQARGAANSAKSNESLRLVARGSGKTFEDAWAKDATAVRDTMPGESDDARDTVVVRDRLDADAMTAAASTLLGLGDFAPFCKKREGATTIRTLIDYSWVRGEDGVVEGRVVADAFCHSMVRALVGAVVPVGEGRREVGFPAEVMPAHGLSLEEVGYPPDGQLADRADEARAKRSLPAPT